MAESIACIVRSESIFQRKLNVARLGGAANDAKGGTAEDLAGKAEIGVIGKVVHLGSELERVVFDDAESLHGGEIDVDEAGSGYEVARGVAKGEAGWGSEGAAEKPLVDAALSAREFPGTNEVGTDDASASVGEVTLGVDGQRESALDGEDA